MLNRKITYILLKLMLFMPLVAYLLVVSNSDKYITILYYILATYLVFIFHVFSKRIKKPKYLNYLLLYIIYLFLWSFFNGELESRGILSIVLNNSSLATLFIIIIIYNTEFSSNFIEQSLLIIKITVVLAFIASIIQFFDQSFLSIDNYVDKKNSYELNIYNYRRSSIFGFSNANELGLSFLPLLSVLIGYFVYYKNKSFFLFLVMGGLIAALSNGRYIMVGFIILTFQYMLADKSNLIGAFKYSIVTLVLVLFIYQSIANLGYNFNSWIDQRLFSEGSLENTTRFGALANFIIFFPQSPVFGTGVSITKEIKEASEAIGSSQIHVGYLSHLVSYGLVGGILLFGFWINLARDLYRTAKKTKYWGSFFAFIIFFWAQATLVYTSIFFYGLIFALVFDKYFKDKYLLEIYRERQIKQLGNYGN